MADPPRKNVPTSSAKSSALRDLEIRERVGLWESSLAPLSDAQKEGVMSLSAISGNRPYPKNLASDKAISSLVKGGGDVRRSSSLAQGVEAGEGVEFDEETWSQLERVAGDDGRIETFQQLHLWMRKMDAEMEEDEIRRYRVFSDQMKEYDRKCSELLKEIGQALSLFEEMKKKHSLVSTKTGSLHTACQQLMDEETQLKGVADSISSKLAFFEAFHKLDHRLNSQAMSVTNESFVPLLAKLDDCVHFMKEHPQYKESSLYLLRFCQLQSRALNMVKAHIVATLKSATQGLLSPGGVGRAGSGRTTPTLGAGAGGDSVYSLHYGKFRGSAPKIKSLVKEIELRVEQASSNRLVLEDCHQCYLAQRDQLVTACVAENLKRMEKEHEKNLCSLVRGSCSYVCRVCIDEHSLFFSFFSEESSKLDVFLEGLCYTLYDMLRPLIIKVLHLETLGELCSIFKVEILEDQIGSRKKQLSSCSSVFEQLLEDVQQRLVYKAQKFIQSDIGGYAPSPGDLAYPDKLIVAREASQTVALPDSDSVFETTSAGGEGESTKSRPPPTQAPPPGPADHHAMWYPTVRRTLLCLSKLYRCVERSTFEGLAFEALRACVKSLDAASSLITAKGQIDGSLFLIKHLLILREQIAPFEVNFTIRETHLDFTKTKAAAYEFLKTKSRIFSLGGNNSVLEFLLHSAPELMEEYVDSQKEVDLRLKKVCEQFILHVTTLLTAPLRRFLGRVGVLEEIAIKEGHKLTDVLAKQPFAEAKAVHTVVTETTSLIQTQTANLWFSLTLYLGSEETELILFQPVKTSVTQDFDHLRQLTARHYSEEDQLIIASPLQEQVSLMLARQISKV